VADFPAPVADKITPPDGLATLSSLMSLKTAANQQALQRQALQTGQYTQQSAQAQSVQDQQAAKETQTGAQLLSDPVGNGILDAKGQPTPDAYQKVLQVMPTTGAAKYDALVKGASANLSYKNAFNSLRTDQQNTVASRLAGVAAGTNNLSDIYDGINAIRDTYKGTPAESDINQLADSAKTAVDQAAGKHGLPGAQQVVMGLSRGGIGNAGITGAGGVATPQLETQDSGPAILSGTRAPALQGGGFSPVTSTVKAPGPTQTIPYVAASAAASAGAGTRASGVGTSDVDRANQVSAQIQPSTAAIETTKKIDDLADQIHSGKLADWVSKGAAAVGASPIAYARQLMEKDLGQVKSLASAGAGSDQRMGTILSGYPEATSAPQTIHTAMDYIRGSFRQNVARGNLLNSYQEAHPDLTGFRHADDTLTSKVDPLMSEYQALKTPAQRTGFYKRNFTNAQEAQEFKDKVTGTNHVVGP
jgi:hypothetical protein